MDNTAVIPEDDGLLTASLGLPYPIPDAALQDFSIHGSKAGSNLHPAPLPGVCS